MEVEILAHGVLFEAIGNPLSSLGLSLTKENLDVLLCWLTKALRWHVLYGAITGMPKAL